MALASYEHRSALDLVIDGEWLDMLQLPRVREVLK